MREAELFHTFADSTYCGDAVVLLSCPKCWTHVGERRERVNGFSKWSFKTLDSVDRKLFGTPFLGHASECCVKCKP